MNDGRWMMDDAGGSSSDCEERLMTQRNPLEDLISGGDSRWMLEFEGFDPNLEPTIEAVFAMVNGYLGTRAALEEGSDVSRPATLIAGVFNTPDRPQTVELEAPIPEIVVAPDWSRVRIVVEGQELRLGQVELLGQRRVLDMRQGLLLREWRVRHGGGRITSLRSLRFVSLDDRHTLVQLLMLMPENYSGQVTLESIVDGRVANENNVVHLAPTGARAIDDGALLTLRTLQTEVELAFAAHADLRDTDGRSIDGRALLEDRLVGARWEWRAEQGHVYELRKLVAAYTSRDGADPAAAAAALLGRLVTVGGAALLNAQTQAWAARWDESDAEISGDDEIQREVHFAVYHLIGAANPEDERSSVGARALTGERYRGHVFWDNETFVWPFYLFTHPQTARALLMYRYYTLAGARAKARAIGYRGALYAWESADTGEETTPPFIRGARGNRLPVLTGVQEHHIAADIAYAVCQYRQVTGDEQFFLDAGAEMLLDIARFWASRATLGGDGRYHILTVIGPDEYHEAVDDNAYTNILAQWALRRGLDTAAELQSKHPSRWGTLVARLDLTPAELDDWRRVADGLVTGFDPATGLFEQFRGYHGLREVDLTGHDTGVATMDRLMDSHELQQTKVLKQSDVVMLLFLLWDSFPPEVREANFRYYEPRTAHDSSLSPSFHALVAARLGDLTLAERFLRQAARIDLDFTRKGWVGATGGVHIAALGGIWQALAFGFLGMRPQDQGLRFEPHIPAHWGALRMPIRWRGSLLRVTATAEPLTLEIAVESGGPVTLAFGDGPWQTVAVGSALRAP